MNLFKFLSTNTDTASTLLEAQAINGYTSAMWVERYLDPGEFEIQAQLSSGLREFLPLGTIIGHIETNEIMIVENHEIGEKGKEDPTLTITGRSFESWLENRVVGIYAARRNSTISEYILAADYTWNQAVRLISEHISGTSDANDSLPNVLVSYSVSPPGTSVARSINKGNVHQRALEILAVDDLGIRTIRRNPWGTAGPSPGETEAAILDAKEGDQRQTIMLVYRGANKSANVIFSWKSGDLSSAQYLFTQKKLKNSAMVLGRYVYQMVDNGPIKYNRRMMVVDASDLDGNLNAPPTGSALTTILNKMTVRGQQALKNQQSVIISQSDISNITKYQYRKDYNIGDLVSLDGNFGVITVMRVTEYAEVEDENGVSGHPTLAIPGT
jgi:hypothetical protein